MAVTRSKSKSIANVDRSPSEVPQLIPVFNTAGKSLSLAASSILQKDNVFDDDEAAMIATALNHTAMLPSTADDPYFTPEQWSLHQDKVEGLVDGLYEAAVAAEGISADNPLAVAYRQSKSPRCECVAHRSDQEIVWTSQRG